MLKSWDFDNCRCLFPWKRESEAEKEPVGSALGASDSEGRGRTPQWWSLDLLYCGLRKESCYLGNVGSSFKPQL